MVPQRPDGARERAGDRRSLRAVRRGGGRQEPRAVVLPDHRVRRSAARRDVAARVVARARADDAAELDRPLRGSRGRLSDRGARCRAAGVHDEAGHAVRGHVLRARPGAPAGGGARPRHRARGRRSRLHRPHRRDLSGRARRSGAGEDGRLHRTVRDEPGERRAASGLGRRLRASRDGTGAIMAVPGHDQRDFEFAERFGLEIRQVVEPADGSPVELPYVDKDAGARWVHWRSSRGWPRPTRSLASSAGSRPKASARPPSATGSATGCSRDSATGRTDTDRPLRRLRSRPRAGRPAPRPAARSRRLQAPGPLAARGRRGLGAHDLPALRRGGAPGDGHDGHLRRLVLVLPALRRSRQRPRAVRAGDRRLLAARPAVHRRSRARDPAPAVRPVLHEGDERSRPARLPRAVPAPVHAGNDHAPRGQDVEVKGGRRLAGRDD